MSEGNAEANGSAGTPGTLGTPGPETVGIPPFTGAGWLTSKQAAERLGVAQATLTCGAWKWRDTLRAAARKGRLPGGGRSCLFYPAELIERLHAEREKAAEGPEIPAGHVDKDGAARMFGLSAAGWKTWIRMGRVRFGHEVSSASGKRRKVYAVADLERLREELFGEDKLYKSAENGWHVPAGYMRRDEAWATLGVGMKVWERWEREGVIRCGVRAGTGPKLYKVEDIHRLLDEYGRWAPPYPDPERPGVVRVPLSGRDIKRREALIDADALPLIEGGSCSWSQGDVWGFVSFKRGELNLPLRRLVMGVTETRANVRHRNEDPLDCRRENLAVRTVAERVRNKRKVRAVNGRPPTSRFKGVFWETWTGRWRATIRCGDVQRQLGRFDCELAAAEAYDEAARELFGEHARLNFPDGIDAAIEAMEERPAGVTRGVSASRNGGVALSTATAGLEPEEVEEPFLEDEPDVPEARASVRRAA